MCNLCATSSSLSTAHLLLGELQRSKHPILMLCPLKSTKNPRFQKVKHDSSSDMNHFSIYLLYNYKPESASSTFRRIQAHSRPSITKSLKTHHRHMLIECVMYKIEDTAFRCRTMPMVRTREFDSLYAQKNSTEQLMGGSGARVRPVEVARIGIRWRTEVHRAF